VEGVPTTRPLNLCNAINEALHIALDTNERTLVFGEDVAFGGVFRCTAGLLERHGRHRVFNTPLCEQVRAGGVWVGVRGVSGGGIGG
jgi:2-oxoisovalerate dehydrogenase E1 component beta subunit